MASRRPWSARPGRSLAESIAAYATALADGVDAALPGWVQRCVARLMVSWAGSVAPVVASAATVAGERARADVMPRLRTLLAADIDDQATTPLAIVREAVRYPTGVLAAAGVPQVERDDFAVRAFPADAYGLAPASFADLDPGLAEVGIAWGAAKAFEHKRRHGP